METIKASATRKIDGWAPTLEYQNGGRVIGQQRCATMDDAKAESADMITKQVHPWTKKRKQNHE